MVDARSLLISLRVPRPRIANLAAVFFVILFARRFAQLLHPQVWDEDGGFISDFILSGPLGIIHPINGYLAIVPKIISFTSLLLPLQQYALTSTVLTWAFIIAVLLAIVESPTIMLGGPLLALAVLLVPSDPEVFGIPVYTLWWAPLLAILSALWKPGAGKTSWRIAFIVVGGLSSPLVAMTVPLALARAIRYRSRAELISFIVTAVCAAAQAISVIRTAQNGGVTSLAGIFVIIHALPRLVGVYPIGNLLVQPDSSLRHFALLIFAILPILLITLTLWRQREYREVIASVTYLWIGAIVFSCVRADPNVIDPTWSGPRYFFYIFAIEGWLLIQLALCARSKATRVCASLVLILASFNTLPVLSRTHVELSWQLHIMQCERIPDTSIYNVPIEFVGLPNITWNLPLTGFECRQMGRYGIAGLILPRRA